MPPALRRFEPQSVRFRNTLRRFEAFSRDVNVNLDADLAVLMQDAFDAHLALLDAETDFPAQAVPAWATFRSRYVSDLTGNFIELYPFEDSEDVVRTAVALAEAVRSLIETGAGRFEHNDNSEDDAAPRLAGAL